MIECSGIFWSYFSKVAIKLNLGTGGCKGFVNKDGGVLDIWRNCLVYYNFAINNIRLEGGPETKIEVCCICIEFGGKSKNKV